jgi:hypothetical protein
MPPTKLAHVVYSDAFAANPIGVEVDFDALLEKYKN